MKIDIKKYKVFNLFNNNTLKDTFADLIEFDYLIKNDFSFL